MAADDTLPQNKIRTPISAACKLRLLRVARVVFGLIVLVGMYPLMNAWWPAGWRWSPNQAEYEQMIVGVYATSEYF